MGVGEDRISVLPNELLHAILVHLRSTRAAARTGVLSRRWRRVWTSLSELVLEEHADASTPPSPPTRTKPRSSSDSGSLCQQPATTDASWPGALRGGCTFASDRVVGVLSLHLPLQVASFFEPEVDGEEAAVAVLELPACEGVIDIDLILLEQLQLTVPFKFEPLLYFFRGASKI
ncbi:unnamed protein product [Urochloa humidicola]